MLTFKNKKMMIPTKKQEGRSPGNEADNGTNGFEAANTTAEQNVRGRVGGKAQEIPQTREGARAGGEIRTPGDASGAQPSSPPAPGPGPARSWPLGPERPREPGPFQDALH